MKRIKASGNGSVVGNVEANGAICFVRQRKVAVGSPGQSVRDSFMGILPSGIPLSVRSQVQGAIQDCVARVISALASIKAVGVVMASNVNRISVSGNEFLLQTAGGKVICLKNNRMIRLLLMLLCNPDATVSRSMLNRAEQAGAWVMASGGGNGRTTMTGKVQANGKGDDDGETDSDDMQATPAAGCHVDGETCGPATDEATLDDCHKRLLEIRAQRKEAAEKDDENKLTKLDDEAKKIARYIVDATYKKVPKNPTKIRQARPKSVSNEIRRIHTAFERVIANIKAKDPELGEHLDCAIVRNGAFRYNATPYVKWDIAAEVLTSSRANAHVPVSVQD